MPVAGRQEIIDRIVAALESGSRPEQIRPHEILGVRVRDLDGLSDHQVEAHPPLGDLWRQARERMSLAVSASGQAAMAAPSGAGLGQITPWLDTQAREAGRCVVLEMHNFPASRAMLASSPEGWVNISLKPVMNEQTTLPASGSRARVAADPERRDEPPVGFRAISLGEEVVAWLSDDNWAVRLLVNPLAGDGCFSAADMARRGEIMRGILGPIFEQCTGAWHAEPEVAGEREALAEALELVNTVRGMAGAQLDALERTKADALQELAQARDQVAEHRRVLEGAVSKRRRSETRARALRRISEEGFQESAQAALREVERIASIASVRSLSAPAGAAILNVGLVPLVIGPDEQGRSRQISGLTLRIDIANGSNIRCQAGGHPLADEAGLIDLGDAAIPVSMAAGEGRWATVVTLLIGLLAQMPSAERARTPLRRFPVSTLPSGWQVETSPLAA